MMSLQETLNLNNKAVALYHSNDIGGAAKTYYASLCLAKELLQSTAPLQESVNHRAPTPFATTLPQHECFHTSTEVSSSIPMQEKFFVYQSALVLQEAPSFVGVEHRVQSMNIYCAGILFNTAILHHQKSIKTGISAFMHRAEQLYQASLQLIVGLPRSNDTVALIAFAATNNLAQIEFEKGLVMQASERLRFLVHLLRSSENTAARVFAVDEFHGMLSNTLLANGVSSSPAA
ncbi:unnamed protein product [Cylindrotheca closterium]|uniref:Uncharacterized protein n=1 Tax=Cylindrotheca closterium TaxID=2856 RepID=A0AAD2CE84_9STRA|nr:unnamed protein product [Cylindrotheca closterium]